MSQWDKLSGRFDTHKNQLEIDPSAADNILIAWPSLLRGIEGVQRSGRGLKVLDFGCGTGGFCKELQRHKYDVTGIDSSAGMIEIAKRNLPSTVHIYGPFEDDISQLQEAPFNLITAVMVFQFIENVSATFRGLVKGFFPEQKYSIEVIE